MPEEREPPSARARTTETSLETVRTDALPAGAFPTDVVLTIELHRRTAARLLAGGEPARAMAELVAAAREQPMTPALAAALAHVALHAGGERVAIALLSSAAESGAGTARRACRRQLVRLHRRAGNDEAACDTLVGILAEDPSDRRAQRVLDALYLRSGRLDDLEASLEAQTREAVVGSRHRLAARLVERRARIAAVARRDLTLCAVRYGQAAQYAQAAQDLALSYRLRMLELRSLRDCGASQRALAHAGRALLALAERLGETLDARRALTELGVGGTLEALPIEVRRREEALIARRAWGELSAYYRDLAGRAPGADSRLEALTKLAEILETELGDHPAAARVYGELFSVTGEPLLLAQQVRLLGSHMAPDAVEATLTQTIAATPANGMKAVALEARAGLRLSRGDAGGARADLVAALQADPGSLSAFAALAETGAALGDREAFLAFQQALSANPRGDAWVPLQRRLAHVALALGDLEGATRAFTELLTERPEDPEAREHLGLPPPVPVAPAPGATHPMLASSAPRSDTDATRPIPLANQEDAAATQVDELDGEPALDEVMELGDDDILEVISGEHAIVKAAGTEEVLGLEAAPVAPSRLLVAPEPSRASGRAALFQRVREAPLDAGAYLRLAQQLEREGEGLRSALMRELGMALEGLDGAPPQIPALICSPYDRAGLRHPSLRNETGELLGLAGAAMCALFPGKNRLVGSGEPFRMDSGRGAPAAADALLAAVRILGVRAPELYVSDQNDPPFRLVAGAHPRLLVGRSAVRRAQVPAELRFLAARALFSLHPDILALTTLEPDELTRALALLAAVLRPGRRLSSEAQAVRDALSTKTQDRLRELLSTASRSPDVAALRAGARHSLNRAGLVVAGGVGPGMSVLRREGASLDETVALVRFASSERYLRLRQKR